MNTITVKYSIFVREQEQRINALSDLTGKDVIVMRGSIAHDLLKQQNFRGNLILTNDTMASLRMLAEGKHDAALLVRLQGLHLLNQFKLENIKAVGEPFAPRKFSFAVNKNAPELLFRINEALVVLKATGEYDRIYDKWFGILTDQGMSYENIVRYSVMMAAAVGSLFLLMAAWLQILRRQVRSRTLLLENAYDDLETRVEERTHDLGERIKELTGLYALSNIFNHENRSISEILQAITEVLPPAWHYPDITSAQITYGDQAFTSSNFQETSWCQNCDIVVSNETVGAVNIYYREQMPELFEGPFLEEERNLIDDIAHRIGEYIERNKTEDDLINEQEYSALQRKFVALVSHEFRTPLSIIDGIAQRMVRCKRQITPDVLREKSEKIRSAVERMTDLIENTLYAARLEENKIELTPVPINPGNMIREICSLHSDISSEHDIRADITGLPSTISADEKLLSIVFNNLLSNAIKFAPKSPLIEVKGWTDDKHAVVRVSDHGVGIPKEDLPVMFERFFRAKTAEGIKGTGIGLTISKEIIEMHGGTIEVDSIEGEGSTFTVRLPIDGERQLY